MSKKERNVDKLTDSQNEGTKRKEIKNVRKNKIQNIAKKQKNKKQTKNKTKQNKTTPPPPQKKSEESKTVKSANRHGACFL